jgi:hypothetical protein
MDATADRGTAAGAVRLDVTDTGATRPAAALYRSLAFAPTGERSALESDPSLETIVMTRSP